MITRMATLSNRLGLALLMLFTIAACGGGGGGGGGGGFLGEGAETPDTYVLTLSLVDANGNPTSTVTSTQPATLRIQANNGNANGQPVADLVVNVTTTLGVTSPASGSTLTNASGLATILIESNGQLGAGTIQATATAPAGEVSATTSFEVGSPGLRLGHFSGGVFQEGVIGVQPDSNLVWRGTAQLTVDIVDENGERVTDQQSVTISSECLVSGDSTLAPANPLQTTNGQVVTDYTAVNCQDSDTVTAELVDGIGQASATLTIGSVQANRLIFVGAEPDTIVLRGTGGTDERRETSIVTFRVLDGDNNPAEGIQVNFSLTSEIGGLSLSPNSAISDAEGNIEVSLSSGDVSTVVRVIASIQDDSGTDLSTVSNILTVTTGLPDQNSISVAVEQNFIVENGMTVDGVERTITVSMADKFNNPVLDGTSAIFTTEYGTIDPSCVTGVSNGERQGGEPISGQCSVMWTSGEPRQPTLDGPTSLLYTILDDGYSCPSHNANSGPCPDDLGFGRVGRGEILVTAIGEESFVDSNGNGVMDQAEAELFANLSEAWIDHNEDGVYTPGLTACINGSNSDQCVSGSEEVFVDFNANGQFDRNDNPAMYNGLLCPVEGDGVWCSRELVNVRDSLTLTLSGSDIGNGWYFNLARESNGVTVTRTQPNTRYIMYVSDIFNNPPPGESTINITVDGGCVLLSDDSITIPNISNGQGNGAYGFLVQTAGEGEGVGSATVTVTSSGDREVTQSTTFECQLIAPTPPPDPNGLIVGGG